MRTLLTVEVPCEMDFTLSRDSKRLRLEDPTTQHPCKHVHSKPYGKLHDNTTAAWITCSRCRRVLRHRVFTDVVVHTIALVTLCFVYIIPPRSPSWGLPLFLIPREYPMPCSPSIPLCRTGVTCGADRRKGVWGGVGGDCQGGSEEDEGWFKRVNTSQLRSRRTLLGHWSDRDTLHSPLPRPPTPLCRLSVSLLPWFSWCPFYDVPSPFESHDCESGRT